MKKYALNCSIYYYTLKDGCHVLYSSETYSDDLDELECLIDEFSGTVHTDSEYDPSNPCIKFSAFIGYIDEKENLCIIKEKYKLLDLKDYYHDFWLIAEKLPNYLE